MTLTVGGHTWKSPSIDPDTHRALVIHDLRQALKIEVWDEDRITSGDKIGQAGPYSVFDAIALSGKPMPVHPSGSLQLNTSWLRAIPKELGDPQTDGCIVCVKVSAIILPLDLGESAKLQATLDAGKHSRKEETRVVKRSESRLLSTFQELKQMGVHPKDVDKLQSSNKELLKKMGILTHLYIHAHADNFSSATLTLSVLVEKKGKFHAVGHTWKKKVSDVSKLPDCTMPGPIKLGSSIEVHADIELWGLIPDDKQANKFQEDELEQSRKGASKKVQKGAVKHTHVGLGLLGSR
mmetsp:Transcript_105179/g.198128  ORF Transcript_105179/g.198128 Transcript_105179/m.198128 type:complete len:294 (-) Transcript_105179:132-1013(-)